MIPAYSFPIPMMPYIYGYTRMLMQFKELPAYCAAEGEAPDGERSEQLNVSRLRKISSITAVLKSCQLTPFQFKAMPGNSLLRRVAGNDHTTLTLPAHRNPAPVREAANVAG